MRIAAIPGSYDPVTLGHVDIIRRAARLYDTVLVVAMVNVDKAYCFTSVERVALLCDALGDIPNVVVAYEDGYFFEYAKRKGVTAIVKGVRTVEDFAYELDIARFNRQHYPEAETLLMPADEGLLGISSSAVKEMARRGEDIGRFVTPLCAEMLKNKYL